MQKVDRLSWEAGVSLRAYGARIGVRVNTASALDAIELALGAQWKRVKSPKVDHLFSVIVGGEGARKGVRHYSILYDGAARVFRTLDPEELKHELEAAVDFKVAQFAQGRVFVHAGVVGWKGRAILVPGPSRSGKTTLVRALIDAGAEYYSDEFAVLDSKGRVHPFPRAPRVRREGSWKGIPMPLHEVGGTAGERPIRVGLIIDSRYEAGTDWSPKRISPAEGFMSLFSNTVVARTRPREAVPTLGHAIQHACSFRGPRGDAATTASRILERFGREARADRQS